MLTYADVREVLGPIDDDVAAEIVRMEATREELVEALAWTASDEALVNDMRPPPSGTVAALVELLEADALDDADGPEHAPEDT
jgi:hypothetical protein